jgi:predicted Zn-dependent protease
MLARVIVVAVAVAVIAFGAVHLHRDRTCEHAHYQLLYALAHQTRPPGGLDAQIRTLTDHCDDPVALEGISILLTASGRPAQAVALANLAIRRDPESQVGYAALAQALDRTDPAGAARARAKVAQLNPRGAVGEAPTHVGVR